MEYGIVTEVSQVMVNLLRKDMVPDLILNADSIGLCSPDEKSDFNVGINLYDIQKNDEIMPMGMESNGTNSLKFPGIYLSLYYMITVYSGSEAKFRAGEEQKLIGRIIQIMHDNPNITEHMLGSGSVSNQFKIKIEFQKLNHEEKARCWNYQSVPYKLSLFYKVSPVNISSRRSKEIHRVVDMDFTLEEHGK